MDNALLSDLCLNLELIFILQYSEKNSKPVHLELVSGISREFERDILTFFGRNGH